MESTQIVNFTAHAKTKREDETRAKRTTERQKNLAVVLFPLPLNDDVSFDLM